MSGFTLYCSQSLVQLIMSYFYCGHPLWFADKMISIYVKFKISGHSIPTKKTHDETRHSHRETVPYWNTGMIHCCIECTE
jgi:cephalosporin hydroxylase